MCCCCCCSEVRAEMCVRAGGCHEQNARFCVWELGSKREMVVCVFVCVWVCVYHGEVVFVAKSLSLLARKNKLASL